MRRIMMFNRVTADGYFTAADGSLGWAVPEEELDKEGAAASAGGGTVLFGRRTYEMFASFWPRFFDDAATAPDPHAAGRRSPALRDMAVFLNEAEKLVFSRTLAEVTWKNARLLRRLDPREIAAMKSAPGKDMIVFGSGSIVSQLTEHGLIDEYQLVVSPVFLGGGRSLIAGLPKSVRLDLLEAKTYPAGNVMLRYAPIERAASEIEVQGARYSEGSQRMVDR
jgi:dihydrofolate reductase